MSTRKQFISAAATVPLLAAAPSPQPKPVSDAAKALAIQMRTFDSALTDKQVEEIAKGIDDNLKVGARVNPHGTFLKNWDEPWFPRS